MRHSSHGSQILHQHIQLTRHNPWPNSPQKVQKLQHYAKRVTRFKLKSSEKVSRVRLPTRMPTRNAHDITHPFQFPYNKGRCNIAHMVHKSSNTTNSHNITPEPNSNRKGKKHYKILQTWLHVCETNPAKSWAGLGYLRRRRRRRRTPLGRMWRTTPSRSGQTPWSWSRRRRWRQRRPETERSWKWRGPWRPWRQACYETRALEHQEQRKHKETQTLTRSHTHRHIPWPRLPLFPAWIMLSAG